MTPQENFSRWADEHYEMTGEPPTHRCRRCGHEVGYLTKHAKERHGDDIEVMPVRNSNAAVAALY
jgi:hypothetical protein